MNPLQPALDPELGGDDGFFSRTLPAGGLAASTPRGARQPADAQIDGLGWASEQSKDWIWGASFVAALLSFIAGPILRRFKDRA